MYRFSSLLRRTSRKGNGGWTEPTLTSKAQSVQMQFNRPGVSREEASSQIRQRDGNLRSRNAAGTGSIMSDSSTERQTDGSIYFNTGGGSPRMYNNGSAVSSATIGREEAIYRARQNWKADPIRGRVETIDGFNIANAAAAGQRETVRPDEKEDPVEATGSTTWTGGSREGEASSSTPATPPGRGFGEASFDVFDGRERTITGLLKGLMDATFQPKEADSTIFGGDGATKKADMKEQFKSMNSRISPVYHEDLLNDYLKNIGALHGPSGQLCDREMLNGRLVGLLFFSETDRCMSFMHKLRVFHHKNSPDFVVVAISLGNKEMLDVTRAHGFYHCTHRHGASWVMRDAGVTVGPFSPLPKLIIVNGTNGIQVTRGGVVAVHANPDTCFSEWKHDLPGYEWRDYMKTFML